MKFSFHLPLALVFVLLFCFQAAEACSIIEMPSLRKDFRQAKDVFLGEIVSLEKRENSAPILTFTVKKSWKGNDAKVITIKALRYCNCPPQSFDFQVGKKFLVMTISSGENKNLIFEACTDHVFQLDQSPVEAKKAMKRLDRFWFRAWARVYPF